MDLKKANPTAAVAVERVIDCLGSGMQHPSVAERMAALLAQMDLLPERANAFDPLDWDALGLPK